MNETWTIAQRALDTLWRHRILWFFGFFVAAGGGGGAVATSNPNGAEGGGGALASLPTWALALMAAGLILGLVVLALHVVSEAALIEGVRQSLRGEHPTLRRGMREGWRHAGSMLGLKLLAGLAFLVVTALVAAAPLLGALGVLPAALVIALTLPALTLALPLYLTLYFLYQWAMRFLVLEDRTVGEALREARRYLPGRLRVSLELTLFGVLGQIGAGTLAAFALIPAALLAGLAYLVAGWIAAIVAGVSILLPVAAVAAGAGASFRSSLWTLHFLEHAHTT